jgi:hypothetical protein
MSMQDGTVTGIRNFDTISSHVDAIAAVASGLSVFAVVNAPAAIYEARSGALVHRSTSSIAAVASDGAWLYWLEYTGANNLSNVLKCATTDCSRPVILTTLNAAVGILLDPDGSALYSVRTLTAGSNPEIIRCALPDCAGGPAALATLIDLQATFAVDDSYLYYADLSSLAGYVNRVPK